MSALAALQEPALALEEVLDNPPQPTEPVAPETKPDADLVTLRDPRLPEPVARVVADRRRAEIARLLGQTANLMDAPELPVTAHGAPTSWFLNAAFDQLEPQEAFDHLLAADPDEPFRYVSFLDAARLEMLLREGAALSRRYIDSWMTLCSGRGLSLATGLNGSQTPVTPIVPFTRAILETAAETGDTIAIIGSDGPEISRLVERYQFTNLRWYSPAIADRSTLAGLHEAAAAVSRANARYTLLCLGWPYDEAVAQICASRGLTRGVGVCVGDALDHIAHERVTQKSQRQAADPWASSHTLQDTLQELPLALKLWRRSVHLRKQIKRAERFIQRQRTRAHKAAKTSEHHKKLAATS